MPQNLDSLRYRPSQNERHLEDDALMAFRIKTK